MKPRLPLRLRFVMPGLCLLLATCPAPARTITVNADGTGDYPTIQAAIDAAKDSDIVVVADGTYTGNGNRDIRFKNKAITVRSQNGPGSCIIDCQADENDQHYGFSLGGSSFEAGEAVLEGFTVKNGYFGWWEVIGSGDFAAWVHLINGGVTCFRCRARIVDCVITSHSGHAIDCLESDVLIECCHVIGTPKRSDPAGIRSRETNVRLVDCVIYSNAGIGLSASGGDVDVSGSSILYNADAGIRCYDCSVMLTRDRIVGNQETGISLSKCAGAVRDCLIESNSGSYSGGMACGAATTVAVQGCLVAGNRSSYCGAGILCSDGDNSQIANCTIVGNYSTGWGGGVCAYWSAPTLINCIIRDNVGDPGNPQICLRHTGWPSQVTVASCNVQGGQAAVFVEPECELTWGEGNTDVQPCFEAPGYWADARDRDTVVEPNAPFATWVPGDYHLKSQAGRWDPATESWIADDVTSPCIDAGDPMTPIGHEPFPTGGIVNMGAYGGTAEAGKSYFGQPLCQTIVAGDINGDCKVDYADLALLCLHWLQQQ